MVHVFFAVRGIKKELELWECMMRSQMWWWKRQKLLKDAQGNFIPDGVDENGVQKYKRGAEDISRVQGSLRPIKLYEYIIPEKGVAVIDGKHVETDNLKELIVALNLHTGSVRKEMAPIAWTLRKALHAKPIPEYPDIKDMKREQVTSRFIHDQGVAVYPIGIKQDTTKDFLFTLADGTKAGFYQEGL